VRKNDFREFLEDCGLTEADIPFIELQGTRGKWKAVDSRTFEDEEGCYHVYPFGFDGPSCLIACPLCGEIHIHGAGREHKNYGGYRVAHCKESIGENYCIEELS